LIFNKHLKYLIRMKKSWLFCILRKGLLTKKFQKLQNNRLELSRRI